MQMNRKLSDHPNIKKKQNLTVRKVHDGEYFNKEYRSLATDGGNIDATYGAEKCSTGMEKRYTDLMDGLTKQIISLNHWREKAIVEAVEKDRYMAVQTLSPCIIVTRTVWSNCVKQNKIQYHFIYRALANLQEQLTDLQQEFDISKEECLGHQNIIQELKLQLEEVSFYATQLYIYIKTSLHIICFSFISCKYFRSNLNYITPRQNFNCNNNRISIHFHVTHVSMINLCTAATHF